MNGRVSKKIRKHAIEASDTITTEALQNIRIIAQDRTNEEKAKADGLKEFSPKDRSGKNYDGAYELGFEDGAIYLARKIVAQIDQKALDEVEKVS